MVIVEPGDGISYGMAAVTNWVDEDDFPLAKSELDDEFGANEVLLAHDHAVTFSELLAVVEEEEFEDIVDLWRALGAALRELDPNLTRYQTD